MAPAGRWRKLKGGNFMSEKAGIPRAPCQIQNSFETPLIFDKIPAVKWMR
jgi:hypothetical protein